MAGTNWAGSPVGAWSALLRHYASAWAQQHAPVGLIQAAVAQTGGLLLVREGGWVSFLRQVCGLCLRKGRHGQDSRMGQQLQ